MTYKSKRALEEKYDISASLTNKLLDEMRQAGIYGQFKIVSDSFLRINAEAMGISLSNLSLRINGHMEFKAGEIAFIRDRYGLTDEMVCQIFFAEKVS